ncbi:hypothetical protein Tco_1124299 [Tanacetum coccineum]|uniref:Uncharacterized protein n=1 Tax=Tanacetum coccineum TaxID=301880 RepID=A0ABQ5J5U6_9ASTR
MVEHEKSLKKKDQIALNEELTLKMHAKEQEKLERVQKERVAQEEATREAIIKKLDSIQAMIEADEEQQSKEVNHLPKLRQGIECVNSFVPMDSEVMKSSVTRTEGSSKRTGDELESDKSKKQKIDEHVEAEKDDDQEEAEIKKAY